jgi:tRNA(Ile)-lysidine synthase
VIGHVEQFIEEHGLLSPGETIIAAVSGGVDSMVMLHVLRTLAKKHRYRIHVVHVNHQLRGEESDEDARFVQAVCADWDVPCEPVTVDVVRERERNGRQVSVQVAARNLRYRVLVDAAKRRGAAVICTAHHANDQAETVLLRILNGTSPAGLRGIPKATERGGVRIVRPLHNVWKEEIMRYANRFAVPFRTDSSNTSLKYVRNQVRFRVLPYLEKEYNKNIQQRLYQLGTLAEAEDAFLDGEAKKVFSQVVSVIGEGCVSAGVKELLALPLALQRRVITLILYCLGGQTFPWAFVHVEAVRRLLLNRSPGAIIDLPRNIRARREYDFLHVFQCAEPAAMLGKGPVHISRVLTIPGNTPVPELGVSVETVLEEVGETGLPECPRHAWEACFDYDAMAGLPVAIRNRLPGDTMRPRGFSGTKKLKKLFMESHIPKHRRDRWPILTVGNEIVWLVGIRRGSGYEVTRDTQRVLRIRVTPPGDASTMGWR